MDIHVVYLLLLDKSLSVFGIHVDVEFFELPRLDLIGKQNVQLFIGASLALRKSEEGPKKEYQRCSSPEERSLAFPVQCSAIQEVGIDGAASDVGDIVCDSSETDTLISETSCRGLANNGIADWSDGEVVDQEPQEHHSSLCVVASYAGSIYGADGTGSHEYDGEQTQTPEIQSAATKSG